MGIKEDALALADELEGMDFREGCSTCPADGTKDCRGDLSCEEAVARATARRIREVVENDACEDTTVSAYDLLPDEDRKAVAWVCDHGGLDAVEKRLMPEGMEWPRFEDEEPVCIGSDFGYGVKLHSFEVTSILFTSEGCFLEPDYSWEADDYALRVKQGERVKRPAPKVVDADGVEIRVGDTVWDVESGIEYEVVGIHTDEDTPARVMRTDGSHLAKAAKPSTLSHQRPVLDADGVPIKKGDTVYVAPFDDPLTVRGFAADGRVLMDYHSDDSFGYRPERLTHAKPEQPDTWERLKEDAENTAKLFDKFDSDAANDIRDLVRRAKKLAEKE